MSNSIYGEYTPPQSGGLYLRINDGETVTLRIASEPAVFDSEYKGNISTKYAWKVYNFNEDVAQVFQNSATFYSQIANLAEDEEYGDPTQYNIKVTRKGEGTDTKYHVLPGTKREPLTEEQQAKIDEVDLIGSVEKSPSAMRVQMLSDVVKNGREQVDESELPTRDINEDVEDPLMDEDDKPINLDEIPF